MKAHVGNLERAVKEKLPTQTLLDILGSLKKEVVATEQLLRVCNNLSSACLLWAGPGLGGKPAKLGGGGSRGT